MKIQLWSYNYDPEPTGIAPLSTVWAAAMRDRGHEVQVIAAHPHYPEPAWGRAILPRREVRDGIPTLRLPLWAGRGSAVARVRQELTFTVALTCATPWLRRPDVIVAVSPSFPALAPTMATARLRRTPWVLWLQDILPDGATATGLLRDGALIRAARRFESAAYRSARRTVVISESFAENLVAKGVPAERVTKIFNPASYSIQNTSAAERMTDGGLVMTMGNIGHSQNLEHVVRAFEASRELAALDARFVLAGDGVAGQQVRAAIRTDRVTVTGVLDRPSLEAYLLHATLAIVSQHHRGADFNVPSKLMNFMGYGIPVLAAVRLDSEVARIVNESGGGWVVDPVDPVHLARRVAEVLKSGEELSRRARKALAFAQAHFEPSAIAAQYEAVLRDVTSGPRP